MAFTVIPNSDIDPGSPLSTDLMTKLRDNDDFLFTQTAGLVLVEKKLVTANVQDLTFSGLDGDTDEVYQLIGRILSGAGAAENFTLRPNNVSSNQDSVNIEQQSSAVTRTSTTDLVLSRVRVGGVLQTFDALFWAKRNPNSIATNRALQAQWASYSATLPLTVGHSTGLWDEDATNITSLVVHGPGAGDIKDGSTVALYKLRQS